MMAEPNFWDNQTKAQDIIDKNNALKAIVNGYKTLQAEVDDMDATWDLLQEEFDEEMKEDLEQEVINFKAKVDEYELQLLLDGPHDANNAILEIIFLVQVARSLKIGLICYLECINVIVRRKALKLKLLIIYLGIKQGLKSVTLLIKGHNAYGYLKS